MTEKVYRILFVCMGNICRSPMAEAILRDQVARAGLSDHIEVDSAGTSRHHVSEPAHPGTLQALSRAGIAYSGRARQIERADLDSFDYVLAMDRENLSYVRRASGGSLAEINLFLSYAKFAGKITIDEVPDPYYDNTHDRNFALITVGSQAFLDYVRAEHKL
ncbi:MAG: low molecular weight protein-tyrosine-phosphatase [Chloroflexota bacterium]|nr:low molecular weight protein-tyrosine-phosphatase [Chloroflexota bacterium]